MAQKENRDTNARLNPFIRKSGKTAREVWKMVFQGSTIQYDKTYAMHGGIMARQLKNRMVSFHHITRCKDSPHNPTTKVAQANT